MNNTHEGELKLPESLPVPQGLRNDFRQVPPSVAIPQLFLPPPVTFSSHSPSPNYSSMGMPIAPPHYSSFSNLPSPLMSDISPRGSMPPMEVQVLRRKVSELEAALAAERARANDLQRQLNKKLEDDDREVVVHVPSKTARYWAEDEHHKYCKGIARYGWKAIKEIATMVPSRTVTQVRTHHQKYVQKLQNVAGLAETNIGRHGDAVVQNVCKALGLSSVTPERFFALVMTSEMQREVAAAFRYPVSDEGALCALLRSYTPAEIYEVATRFKTQQQKCPQDLPKWIASCVAGTTSMSVSAVRTIINVFNTS